MKIVTKFDLLEKINIPEIKRPGIVIAIMQNQTALSYQVSYFNNGKKELSWMYEFEIEKTT